MKTYEKTRKLIANGPILLDFAEKHPLKVLSAADAAKLIDSRPGVARALLASLAQDGTLERVERGRYRKGEAVAKAPKAPRQAREPRVAQRRTVVLPEELVKAMTEALLKDCALSLTKDRDHFIAVLDDRHDGVTMAQNRTAELAAMDAVGKWHRSHAAK